MERDTYMYRAYIAKNKPSIALSEIDENTTLPPLKAVRRFAQYMANPAERFCCLMFSSTSSGVFFKV